MVNRLVVPMESEAWFPDSEFWGVNHNSLQASHFGAFLRIRAFTPDTMSMRCSKAEDPRHKYLTITAAILDVLRGQRNKVITTMVIRPLNDRTNSAQSAFTHLGLWRKLYDCSWYHYFGRLQSQKMSHQTCYVDIFVQPFGCNLKGIHFDLSFGG